MTFDTKGEDCKGDLFFRYALEANLAYDEGEYDKAIDHIKKAMSVPGISRYKRAHCLHNLAHLYIWGTESKIDLAMRCIGDAYRWTDPGDSIRCFLVKLQGDVQYYTGHYREAIQIYWAVLQQLPRHKSVEVSTIYCHRDMGRCYLKLGDQANGLRYLNFALRLADSHSGMMGVAYRHIQGILKDHGFVLPESPVLPVARPVVGYGYHPSVASTLPICPTYSTCPTYPGTTYCHR